MCEGPPAAPGPHSVGRGGVYPSLSSRVAFYGGQHGIIVKSNSHSKGGGGGERASWRLAGGGASLFKVCGGGGE